jgi:hypothetical protein
MPQLQTFAPGNLYSHFRPALAENHAQDARILKTHRIPDEHSPAASGPRLPTAPQNRVVFFDELVKKGLLHAMALISRRTLPAAGLPASWQLPGWFSWIKFTWTAEKNGETADNVSRHNVNRDDYGQNA